MTKRKRKRKGSVSSGTILERPARTARGHVVPPCPECRPVPERPAGAAWVILRVMPGEVASTMSVDRVGNDVSGVVRIVESKARAVARRLQALGVTVWVPERAVFVTECGRDRRQPGWRMEPLYPGYAFAAVRPDAAGLALLRGNMHVIGLVLLNGAAVTVPDAVMAMIGAAEAELRTEAMPVECERPAALIGQTVLVRHGLADIRAVVTAAIGRELRLEAAGMTLRVPIDRVERVA